MRMLSCLLLAVLSASPALADDVAAGAVTAPAQVAAPHADVQPAAQDAKPKKRRALACPACSTTQDPSFAIRPATVEAAAAPAAPAPVGPADAPGASTSEPPVNFSFSGSGDGGRSSRYRGGVRVGTSF